MTSILEDSFVGWMGEEKNEDSFAKTGWPAGKPVGAFS